MLAIPWYLIQQVGGKQLNASMVAVVTMLALFWGLYAGTLVDKYNRKRIFLALTAIDSCFLLSVALGTWESDQVPFLLIAMIYTLTIFTYNVHYPNLYAFVQELFEPQYYARVNSAIEIQGQTTSFIGMMLGGILLDGTMTIEWWPEAWRFEAWSLQEIFMLDGSTYILAFILLYQIPYKPTADKIIDKGPILKRLQTGFNYLLERKELLLFGITSHVIFFSLLVVIQVLGPIYVKDYLQESAIILSSLKGVYSLGAITAGIIGFSMFVRRTHLIKQIIFLLFSAGAIYLLWAVTKSTVVTLTGAYLVGICNAGTRIQRITYLVRIVPNHVIGRVNSIFTVINVLMRVSFISLLAIPFFSAEDNGGNIIYACMMLSGIMIISGIVLLVNFDRFDHEAAVGQ